MRERRTVVMIASEKKEVAAEIKKRLKERGTLGILLDEHEFFGAGWSFMRDRFFTGKRETWLNGAIERSQSKRREGKSKRASAAGVTSRAAKGLENALTRYRPDLILIFSPVLIEALLRAREKVCPDVPVFALHTDSAADFRFAAAKGEFPCFAANEGVKEALAKAGMREERITVCSFPVSEVKRTERPFRWFRRQSKAEKPLVVEGRAGKEFRALLPAFEAYKTEEKLVIYCGEDRELFDRLRAEGYETVNEGRTREEVLAEAGLYVTYPDSDLLRRAAAAKLPTVIAGERTPFERRVAEAYSARLKWAKNAEELKEILAQVKENPASSTADNGDGGGALMERVELELGM